MNLEQAIKLATRLHDGQVDKAGQPYIGHLMRVLEGLPPGVPLVVQIAALLHDAIEDRRATVQDLMMAGAPLGALLLVVRLTRCKGESYDDYLRRARQDPGAALIKAADLADNSNPERLALLPPVVADKLRAKYARALEILNA